VPAEETRKIMKHGQSSGVVTIPIAYRRYHKIDPGDKVKIIFDSLLLIVPKGMEHVLKEKKQLVDKLLGQ
jgi:bifunctional DNA-binding transcriptional regulator/antitoxin component of YhaV-PrlF toxin-antitoxin module